MERIKLVCDSTVDLPQEIYQKYGITVLPMIINFGDVTYYDGVDINNSEFYAKLAEFSGFPTTAQITPGVFAKTYKKLAEEADVIISIHVSGKLSGTLNAASLTVQEFEGVRIIVHDTESASLGGGLQVLEAIRAINEGCSADEVIRRMEQVKETLEIYFSVPSLDNLQKGGRIGKAAALIGGLLNIVPLLHINEGEVAPFEKLRGKKRIAPRLMEILAEKVEKFGGPDKTELAVLHAANLEGANELAEKIKAELGFKELLISEVGPTIGVHTGPGVIAIGFHKKIS